ncbi:MAG: hypothetical protein EZS28_015359, partial [Streblomastix strix]
SLALYYQYYCYCYQYYLNNIYEEDEGEEALDDVCEEDEYYVKD